MDKVYEVIVQKVITGSIYVRASSEREAFDTVKDALDNVMVSDYVEECESDAVCWQMHDDCIVFELDDDMIDSIGVEIMEQE